MKVELTLSVDTENGKVTLINATEEQTVEIKAKKAKAAPKAKAKTESTEENEAFDYDFPCVVRSDNSLMFNTEALELLGVTEGDRIHIKYDRKKGVTTPLIAHNEEFGVKAGNKLFKNNTVSWRGNNNETLEEHGTVFKLVEFEGNIYKMIDPDMVEAQEAAKPKKGITMKLDKNIKPINTEPEEDLKKPANLGGNPNTFDIDSDQLQEVLDANDDGVKDVLAGLGIEL